VNGFLSALSDTTASSAGSPTQHNPHSAQTYRVSDRGDYVPASKRFVIEQKDPKFGWQAIGHHADQGAADEIVGLANTGRDWDGDLYAANGAARPADDNTANSVQAVPFSAIDRDGTGWLDDWAGTVRQPETATQALMESVPHANPAVSSEELSVDDDTGVMMAIGVALDALTRRQAEMLSLRLDGISYEQIAQQLDVAVGTVGQTLVNARKKIGGVLSTHPGYVERHLKATLVDEDSTPWIGYARTAVKLLASEQYPPSNTRWRVARQLSDALTAGAPLWRLAQVTRVTPATIETLVCEYRNG
jgi:DNA-binding CsgD family transcriptional regulator